MRLQRAHNPSGIPGQQGSSVLQSLVCQGDGVVCAFIQEEIPSTHGGAHSRERSGIVVEKV